VNAYGWTGSGARSFHEAVGQLLAAKRDLRLEQELKKLDRFDVLILDDIGYVQQSREEMEVLFTLLAERYERRSRLIRSNLVFRQWDQIFKDLMTTMAAIDRLVHHSIILEFDGASQRVKKASGKAPKEEAGQPRDESWGCRPFRLREATRPTRSSVNPCPVPPRIPTFANGSTTA
jgi:hypothetical protein